MTPLDRLAEYGGPLAFLVLLCVPVGILLTPWAQHAIPDLVRAIRRLAYRQVQGRYYEFAGYPIDVREDADGHRWLSARDVRRVILRLPRNGTLLSMEPIRVRPRDDTEDVELRADALAQYLAQAYDPQALRLCRWVEWEVLRPSPAARRAEDRRKDAAASPERPQA